MAAMPFLALFGLVAIVVTRIALPPQDPVHDPARAIVMTDVPGEDPAGAGLPSGEARPARLPTGGERAGTR